MAKQNQGKEREENDDVDNETMHAKNAAAGENWMEDEDKDPMEDNALESDEEETL